MVNFSARVELMGGGIVRYLPILIGNLVLINRSNAKINAYFNLILTKFRLK